MKTIITSCILLVFILPSARAQNRFSIAPTYWFNHGIYNYQVRLLSDPSMAVSNFSGRNNSSSVGLMVRYHFSEKWSTSVGALYYKLVSRVSSPQIGEVRLESNYIQLPALINYRLTTHRVSPYFSAGMSLSKNTSASHDTFKASALMGVGLDYRVSSKFSLLVQPTGSYLLYKPANDGLVQYDRFNSYSIGVQTQAIWRF